eukprot:UN33647
MGTSISRSNLQDEELSLLPPSSKCLVSDKSMQGLNRVYKIRNKLGEGTSASVRRCTRKSDNKDFAVKIVNKKHKNYNSPKEVQLLKKIDHVSCVKLIDVYESENHLFIVTDLCTGGDLLKRLTEQGSFKEN